MTLFLAIFYQCYIVDSMNKKEKEQGRKKRVAKIVRYLKKAYPHPKSELKYKTNFQFVVAVVLSAQCTDKVVNRVTKILFRKYKTAKDFSFLNSQELENKIKHIPFFRNKAKSIIAAAKVIVGEFGGRVPRTEKEITRLPGVGYKTAHVILGELFGVWEGIATDTHVRRFALRFDLTDNTDLTKISKDLEQLIPKKDWKYVNNGLVLYGRYICPARKHDCSKHALTKIWPPAENRWPKVK